MFFERTSLNKTLESLSSVNYMYVLIGAMIYLSSMIWRVIRWKLILNPCGNFTILRLSPVMLVGYATNNLLPIRIGEFIKAYYLHKREGINPSTALATILIERIFDGLTLIFFIGIVSLSLPIFELFQAIANQTNINWLTLTLGLTIPFLMAIVLLTIISFHPKILTYILSYFLKILPKKWQEKINSYSSYFFEGLSALKSPLTLSLIFSCSILIWLSEALVYLVIALGFDFQDFIPNIKTLTSIMILTTATSNLGTAIPSTGGGIGPFEFFSQTTLMFFNIPVPLASAFTLVLHGALLIPITIIGISYMWLNSISLRQISVTDKKFQIREE
jgi:uncharacterized protein (TIRG00374 family)